MKIGSIHMLKSIAIGLGVSWACLAAAEQRSWVPFVTPIKCKTFEAELISVCYQTRKDDEPAICKSQTLKFIYPVKASKLLFTPPHKKSENYVGLGRHTLDWFCSTNDKNEELLTLSIANWFNARDEDIYVFDRSGRRLTRKASHEVAATPAWRKAKGDPKKEATASGHVSYPEFE